MIVAAAAFFFDQGAMSTPQITQGSIEGRELGISRVVRHLHGGTVELLFKIEPFRRPKNVVRIGRGVFMIRNESGKLVEAEQRGFVQDPPTRQFAWIRVRVNRRPILFPRRAYGRLYNPHRFEIYWHNGKASDYGWSISGSSTNFEIQTTIADGGAGEVLTWKFRNGRYSGRTSYVP